MSIGSPQRILIVDDNPDFRERLAHCLRDQGHEVITAETGERAFVVLRDREHPIDWLYTRASLPGLIDGWILAASIMRRTGTEQSSYPAPKPDGHHAVTSS